MVVTFEPISETGAVFMSQVAGQSLTFHTLPEASDRIMLMQDQQTGSTFQAVPDERLTARWRERRSSVCLPITPSGSPGAIFIRTRNYSRPGLKGAPRLLAALPHFHVGQLLQEVQDG